MSALFLLFVSTGFAQVTVYADYTIPGTNITLSQARGFCEKWGDRLVDPSQGRPLSESPMPLILAMEEELKLSTAALEKREKANARKEVRALARESLRRGQSRSALLKRAGKIILEMDERGYYERSGVFKGCAFTLDDLYIQLDNIGQLSQPSRALEYEPEPASTDWAKKIAPRKK